MEQSSGRCFNALTVLAQQVAQRFLGLEKVPVSFLGWEEEDGAGRPAQREWGNVAAQSR